MEWSRREKGLLLWCAALGLMGAHYSTPHTPSGASPPPNSEPAPILAGAGAAAARLWSPTHEFRLVSADAYGRLAALDSVEFETVLKLNRVDAKHLPHRSIVVPISLGDQLEYAPFPASVPALSDVPKFIAVSRRVQAYGAYEYGALVQWGPTSTGKEATPTDSGLFFTNWKSRRAISTEDSSWVLNWYFNIMSNKGVAFHEYDLPGRPASHGCVRLLESDARWIFDWADQWVPGQGSKVRTYGTPVLIFGDYAYGQQAPWLGLADGSDSAAVSAQEMDEALAPHETLLAERAGARNPSQRWMVFVSRATESLGAEND